MLRMAKRYGCKYPNVFLVVLFAVLIASMTGYCSFAYAEDGGAAFKDNYGIDINTDFAGAAIYPMEILDSPNVNVIYRKG